MACTPIPNEFFEAHFSGLSSAEKILFTALSYLTRGKAGSKDIQVEQRELEEFCGLSHVTLALARKGLIQKNLVQMVEPPKRDRPAVYRVWGENPANTEAFNRDVLKISVHDRRVLEAKLWNKLYPEWLKLAERKINMRIKIKTPFGHSAGTYVDFFNKNVWHPAMLALTSAELDALWNDGKIMKTPPFISEGKTCSAPMKKGQRRQLKTDTFPPQFRGKGVRDDFLEEGDKDRAEIT